MVKVHSLQVRINGQWRDSTRFWGDANKAASFIERMNLAGLPARPVTRRGAETYIENATFIAHPEDPDVAEAISDAILSN
jgi:hypothetical protein